MIKVIESTDVFLKYLANADLSENAYLSYDYYRVYLKYFPKDKIICYCVLDGDKCIGLLPLFKNGFHYEILGYRASNYLGYICKKDDTERVDFEISEYISKNHPNDVVDFYDVNSSTDLYSVLEQQKSVEKIELYSCPYVDCNQSFEQLFISQVSKAKKRTELRKFAKKLDTVGEVQIYNIYNQDTWEKYGYLINDIYKLHAERFADVYIPSNVCLHENETYYTELFESLVLKEKALLSVLTVDSVVISFLYTAVSDGIVMDWMPAFDPAFTKYNLGTVHLMKLLEYLCESNRYRVLDFSKGAAVYKARWAKDETKNYMMVKRYSRSAVSAIKAKTVVWPIRFKNFLREKGILDKIKDILAKFKGSRKNNASTNPIGRRLSIVKKETEGMNPGSFSYRMIRDYEISDRKIVLDAIYNGIQPKVLHDDNSLTVILETNEEI